MKFAIRRVFALIAALALLSAPSPAATDKVLSAVRGTTGYQTDPAGTFTRVVGKFLIPDDDFAVTRVGSNALLQLPDSSEIGLGASTVVKVGAFNEPTSSTPTTITLNNGTFRFNIRHPNGGRANYLFQTVTSTTAVRGTIGLIATGSAGDQISCLVCGANDVVVNVGSQTFAVLTGQTLTVSLGAAAVVAATTATALGVFSAAGLSTSAASVTAFAGAAGAGAASAGAGGAGAAGASTGGAAAGAGTAAGAGAAAGAAAATTTAVVAGAVAAGGVAAAVSASQPSPATPQPTPSAAISVSAVKHVPVPAATMMPGSSQRR